VGEHDIAQVRLATTREAVNINAPAKAKKALQRCRAENQQGVSDERRVAVPGAQRRVDAAFDQPWQGQTGKIGGDQGKNTEQEQPAVAVNEKLDPVVIAQNLRVLWFAVSVPRRCNNSSSPRLFQRGIAGCKIQNISRKEAMDVKVGGKRHRPSREYFSSPSELGAFAPWREKDPNPRVLSLA